MAIHNSKYKATSPVGEGRGGVLILSLLLLFLPLTSYAQEEIKVYDPALGKDEVFDVPEGMTLQMDSLLNEYHARLFLTLDSTCQSLDTNPDFDRETYIRRLSHLPNIIEMPYNDIVREFIDRYTVRGRRQLPYLLSACNFYMPIFEEALEAYQLPLELKYLPVIESSLNPSATSRAGAGGLWQFMLPTAKQYGLEVNTLVDERRDPIKSSYAAARCLSDLYKIFNDWTLVIAAYNCGPQNVLKAIRRAGGEEKDYWKIYPHLPKETRGYVPAFIAANYVMTYYCEHGICPARFTFPTATDTVHVSRNVHFDQIAAVCNVPADEIRALNPQFRRELIPGDATTSTLRLSTAGINAFISAGDSVYNYKSSELFGRATVEVAAAQPQAIYHKVKSGETLGSIAKKYRVSVKSLQRLNGMKSTNLSIGQRLRIK